MHSLDSKKKRVKIIKIVNNYTQHKTPLNELIVCYLDCAGEESKTIYLNTTRKSKR